MSSGTRKSLATLRLATIPPATSSSSAKETSMRKKSPRTNSTAPRWHSLGRLSNMASRADRLSGHRDQSGDTSCPGASLYAHVADDLKRRVADTLAAGPVNLQKICGPEASAFV